VPSTQELTGKVAVVTGASSGIGRAIAERLGAAGAHVYLAGRTESAMQASKERIESNGGRATIATGDLRDPAKVQALVEQAARDRPPGRDGHIVNISSNAARRPDSGVYGDTKHAVNVISESLRHELEDDSIRVTTIMPGVIATNFARNSEPALVAGIVKATGVDVDVKQGERLPDEVFEKLPAPLRKTFGRPEDVADALLYAATQPIEVNVFEIVVRPPKQLQL
jgi:NADP-dependent 3-hydroxy acid dehydrogenase YdfG